MKKSLTIFLGLPLFLILMILLGCSLPKEKDSVQATTKTDERVQPAPTGQFLNLSDIHFDPYYDPALIDSLAKSEVGEWAAIFQSSSIQTLSTYGADANYPLLASSLKKMKESIPHPDFIMISGDFLAHSFEGKFETDSHIGHSADVAADYEPLHSFIQKTFEFVKLQFEEAYPGVPIIAALGNNDSYCGDYMVQPGGPFLKMLTDVWESTLGKGNANTFAQNFPKGGYYDIASPVSDNWKFLVVNSILFSNSFNKPNNYTVYCTPGDFGPNNAQPGLDHLKWIENELTNAREKNMKVWMIQHIPPGINTYPSALKVPECVGDTQYFFTADFNQKYVQMIQDYSDVIATNMAGHYHKDDFRLILDAKGQEAVSYMHILPSISPIYNNNPGFEIVDYDAETGMLKDYTVHYVSVAAPAPQLDKVTWEQEYRFSEVYGATEISTKSLADIHKRLETDVELQKKYMLYYPVSDESTYLTDIKKFYAFWCSMNQMTTKGFAECSCAKR